MNIFEVIYPGLGFSSFIFLFLLSFIQFHLYKKFNYERSKDLGLFCFLSSIFSLNIAIIYSNAFSHAFTHFFVVALQFVLFLSFYYYVRSLSYFIVIPNKIKKPYLYSMLFLALVALIPYPWFLLTGDHLYFDPTQKITSGNYFSDAYTARLGMPQPIPLLIMGAFGFINTIFSSLVLYRLQRSSKDFLLSFGVLFTFSTVLLEFVIPSFNPSLYIPLSFFANIFEAFRMSTLASAEHLVESAKENKERVKDSGRQHHRPFSDKQLQELSNKLVTLLEKELIFQNPNLKIETLAKKLKIPTYLVSQVIRFGLNTNFTSLISQYRINYVKKALKDEAREKDSILDIAFEAGFNSKSSFNHSFKRATGDTPSQFRKKASF